MKIQFYLQTSIHFLHKIIHVNNLYLYIPIHISIQITKYTGYKPIPLIGYILETFQLSSSIQMH